MTQSRGPSAGEVASETYRAYYAEKGGDRNDPLSNAEVLFQAMAAEAAFTRALRPVAQLRGRGRVLDVGCGTGNTMLSLVTLGFRPQQLTGIDVIPERIEEARQRVPGARVMLADARAMEFEPGAFDLVVESTMFLQMTDEVMAAAIASEMIRVLAPGGSIVLRDWRVGRRSRGHSPLDMARIVRLFGVGTRTRIVGRERGALLPPVGRFLSKHLPSAYFVVHATLPFLAAQMVTRLQRV